ncbi:MAG: hypothetical protein QG635_1744, partial [Bacteroidota bacterium]|nr:hypothetical protein [Bacteroidota bacterium]
EDGRQLKYMYNLHDSYDEKTKTSSMARTTGYTCTAAVRLVAEGKYSRKGIIPPEYLGEEESTYNFIMNHLKERKIIIEEERVEGEN